MKYIVMQRHLSSKMTDEEGFASSRIEIKQLSTHQLTHYIRSKIPQPKELIYLSRPQDQWPRVLDSGVEISVLSDHMNSIEEELECSCCLTVPLNKIQFNGKGKTLYDYFTTSDFLCIYDKFKDKRPLQQIYYDFTSRIKIIDHTNDYNQKLYKRLSPYHIPALQHPSNLQIDSNFQSGNTRYVYKQYSKPNNYYLLLENDVNTHGYNQWFFFRVRNRAKSQQTFHIMNMIKKQNLYKQGMKVAIFSTKGWYRGGNNIGYNSTGIERTNKANQFYYCLSFSFDFQFENDCVYFALTLPYTYSRAGKLFLQTAKACRNQSIPYNEKTLGYTLSNNRIQIMKIGFSQKSKKKIIVILARQHPCQTMGSFICQGIVKYLVSNSPQCQHLLQQFAFLIIPMVNPDGVIEGNSRCNLSGVDLNRQWSDPIKELTPENFYIKRFLESSHRQQSIQCIIDLHGHSKKMNSFFYCCEKKDRTQMRLLPMMMNKLCEQFDYSSCTYGLTKDKLSTIRGKFNTLGVDCYTLQNSYFGWNDSKGYHCYTTKQFYKIGQAVLKSLFLIHFSNFADEIGYNLNKNVAVEEIRKNLNRVQIQQKSNQQDEGSDSDPDGDLFAIQERLDTLKMKSLLKTVSNSSILKGLSSVSKVLKEESTLVISHRNGLDKKINQSIKVNRRQKGKQLLNLDSEELNHDRNSLDFVKKASTTNKIRKQKLVTERLQGGRETRLASSLNKPSRLQYFAQNQDRKSAKMTKVQSNQSFEQKKLPRRRPVSSFRAQNKYLKKSKNREQSPKKAHTEGQQVNNRNLTTLTDLSYVNEYLSRSPDQKQLKVIEVGYLQQRRQRTTFMQQSKFRSKELPRSNLASNNKFRKFQNFLDTVSDKLPQTLYRQLGNRVFYRFPVL